MAMQNETWSLIESDPGVFTELIEEIGVEGVQVEELYALDAELLQSLRPVYGLIFLFKWRQGDHSVQTAEHEYTGNVFFARQVITNACATQAILSILMNRTDLDLGPELTHLKEFTSGFPPDLKGLAISNSETIRAAHNSFAPPQPMLMEDSGDRDKDDEAYHFISYVHKDGTLYELDGLQPGPIKLLECSETSWLQDVCPIIAKRIEKYAQNEIRFNLMAVIRNREQDLRGKLQALQQSQMVGDLVNTEELMQEQARLQEDLEVELQKRKNWKDENIRRKHNYIPFIFNLLKALAAKHKLQPLIDAASKQQKQ